MIWINIDELQQKRNMPFLGQLFQQKNYLANFLDYQKLQKFFNFRIKSLKKLQLDSTKIESDFYKEVQELECKYQTLYLPLYEKRTQIVKGNQNQIFMDR